MARRAIVQMPLAPFGQLLVCPSWQLRPGDATRAAERKAERGVQPFAESRGGAGEVGVGRCIADPARAAALEDAAGETLTRAERETLAERLELGCAVARVPGADAAKPIIGAGLPDRAELPAEHAADRLERGRVHLDRNVSFREDPIATCLTLAALLLALRETTTSLVLALGCYALALFAKESAIVAPLLYLMARFAAASPIRDPKFVRRAATGFAILTLGYLIIRFGPMKACGC